MIRSGALLLTVSCALSTGCDPGANSESIAPPPQALAEANPPPGDPPEAERGTGEAPEATPPAGDKLTDPEESAPPTAADPYGPLSDAQTSTFHAGEEDGGEPLKDHYVKSNEIRHDTWFPDISGIGGAFIGVGPDQCYTVAGAQRAELVFILDIDHMVVNLHKNYEVFIKASATPEELHARFDKTNAQTSIVLLEASYASLDDLDRRRRLRVYRASRETVFRHLRHVIKRGRDGEKTSWLSDPESYAHIRGLYQNGRVRLMDGDLTGAATMKSIGEATTKLDIPVRVLYLSNAEEYYRYTRQYAANVRGLPADEKSVALRTIYNKEWEHADSLWNYQIQSLTNYQAHLEDPTIRSRNSMLRAAAKDKTLQRTTDVKGVSRIADIAATAADEPPTASK